MSPFGLSGNEFLVAFTRAAFVASVLSTFGVALFLSMLMPPVARRLEPSAACLVDRQCRTVAWGSLLAASMAGLLWLVLETGAIVDAETISQAIATVPTVLVATRFGQVLVGQALALLGARAAMATSWRVAPSATAFLAGAATVLEAGHSHAFAMAHGLSALLLSQALHLLAAGAWLGGLVPLLVVVRQAPLAIAALAARRFSALGLASVATLAVTAIFQGWLLSGGVAGLVRTAYGAVLLVKALLFLVLVVIAAFNRLRLTPRLEAVHGEQGRHAIIRNIRAETIIGLGVVLAASVLSSLEPGMHQV
jgi:copper resistance protein D